MDLTAVNGEMIGLALALLASGAVAGLLAGMFGIGGGAVLVPVLYQFLAVLGVDESVRMHVSVATSLGIIVPTSIRSFLAHKKRGAVDMELLKTWAIPVPAGVVVASLVAASVSGDGLKGIFAVIAAVVGLRMIFNRESWRLGDDIPGFPIRPLCGALIGFFSTLMGIGGGVMNNTFMTLYGRPIHQAVATSSGTGVLISVPGVIGMIWAGWGAAALPPFSAGYVNLLGVALIIPITTLTAPLGVRIAHALKRRTMEYAFGTFLLIVAARFLYSLYG
ncbi:sulfite exporter TauE/SafE family protein [Polymorphum gilvum]|uniref:Probable membrane transporter protein n=1 Tax=Polymorphum gilvum (strain LMG 25793 / CGMCC 1.9160 / SL003B-26A1) TaxID=991905 RepID=F2J601_POLGS|nr:sulfite exporter TauE/SafE family protein [Polymorphum gilvum]ADZ71255.1 Membrane protein [Polymorphum gilvum SL003B-26A1]